MFDIRRSFPCILLLSAGWSSAAMGQFSGSIQGTVQDTSGAVIPQAQVTLTNTDNQVNRTAISDTGGLYRFLSLAPGPYKISVSMTGFTTTEQLVRLETAQTLDVPIALAVGASETTVRVNTAAPLLDTVETRNQLTLGEQSLSTLPLAGRNLLALLTTAPGVTGLGLGAGPATPGSATDNYSTETSVDASANGRSAQGNLYVVDGLDVTSDIRPGVLNIIPNPDVVQEAAIQSNTFSVEYGRASSIQMVMTTKSGTNQFHGSASDYFTNQSLWAGTEFTHSYQPFHSNNISATIGGPIWPKHQLFFFFGIEPLRSTASSGSSITFEDPAFVTWATTTYPNSVGATIMKNYEVGGVAVTGSPILASTAFPATSSQACGTASTDFLPCATPVFDNGNFTSSSFRNGLQFNTRIDKYWGKDRLYGNYFRTTLQTSGPDPRPAFDTTSSYSDNALQINETHTFSSTTLNEAQFGFTRGYGIAPGSGNFTVPVISVTGESAGYGSGFALGNFLQHNYHWRDVLTRIQGNHELKFGYDGWFGDNLFYGGSVYQQPSFAFNSVLDLAQSNAYSEGNLAYAPLTGKPTDGFTFLYHGQTHGVFVQDVVKVSSKVSITYGLRYDFFGNAWPQGGTVATNFFLASGNYQDSIANGIDKKVNAVLSSSMRNVWSPRVGVAYDITGKGEWLLHGGFGVYHDWPSLGQLSEAVALYGSPYGYVVPTFYNNGTTASTPIFALGKSNTPPFGYPYPVFPATGSLDPKGGLTGSQIAIGGIEPHLGAPFTANYAITLEHSLSKSLVATVGYVGSQLNDLLTGAAVANTVNAVSTGVDINRFAGDLLAENILHRLNTSFGSITYAKNEAVANYNGVTVALRGNFGKRGFINASYTRSRAWDNDGQYPTAEYISQYYGPSTTNAPNRFTLSWNYLIPGVHGGNPFSRQLTNGWTLSGVTILQSGYPFTVYTSAPFIPELDSSGNYVRNSAGLIVPATNSGDYNADGYNNDYPNVPNYSQPTSRMAYLRGLFPASQFTAPTPGTEGNELTNRYNNPGFAASDISLLKSTHITERFVLNFRADSFNVFNRPNLGAVTSDLSSNQFGQSTSQHNPRWFQIGAGFQF